MFINRHKLHLPNMADLDELVNRLKERQVDKSEVVQSLYEVAEATSGKFNGRSSRVNFMLPAGKTTWKKY